MITHVPPSGLVGRRNECEVLDRLVGGVLAGQSRVLVLRGEAGVGKTALLEYLVGAAAGCRIARVAGVESEMELPFAGLHALCAPMLGRRNAPARPAARCARHGARSERRAAAGSLPGRAGGAEPARRRRRGAAAGVHRRRCAVARSGLRADAGVRGAPPVGGAGRAGVRPARAVGRASVRRVAGARGRWARRPDARALLDSTLPGPLDERVRDRILAEAGGNPLALLELPRGLTPATVAGGFGLPGSMPLTSRIEQGFVRQLEPLPGETRQLLLLAAAEPVGDVTLLQRAADAARDRRRRGGTGRGRRPDRYRCAGAVPASAGALGGLPRGERAGPPGRPSRAGRGDRPAARSRSARMASRARGGAPRRDRRRRAGALGRPRAQSRRHRRGGRLPRASGRADARSGRPRSADAGRGAGQVRVGGAGGRTRAAGGRADVPAGRASARPARPSARADRVRLHARQRRPAAARSMPPDSSKRSTPRWRARRTSRRSERRCTPDASTPTPVCCRSPRRPAPRLRRRSRHDRSTSCSTDWHDAARTDPPRACPLLRRATEAFSERGSRESRRDHALALADPARPVDHGVRVVGRRRVPRARHARGAAGSRHRRTRPAPRRARLPLRRAPVRRGVRCGLGADPGGGRDRGRDRQRRASCTPGSCSAPGAAHEAERWNRSTPASMRARRGKGGGDGRLRHRRAQQRPGSLRGGRSTAPSAAATTATGGTPARRCQSSSRRQLGPASRRSLPPHCPGWKRAHAPRARTGRSGSWPARRR